MLTRHFSRRLIVMEKVMWRSEVVRFLTKALAADFFCLPLFLRISPFHLPNFSLFKTRPFDPDTDSLFDPFPDIFTSGAEAGLAAGVPLGPAAAALVASGGACDSSAWDVNAVLAHPCFVSPYDLPEDEGDGVAESLWLNKTKYRGKRA